ncbi:ABC transporter ATP-binding protein [Desulfosediminicola sp.]|uniref:ABC transporter ATP-binding protein n=1 Tax=Desulfosediminicola sp. TaxID=2886825 RepID=UPI003AF2E03F
MSRAKLELVALKKEYDNGNVVAVDEIDLHIQQGETLALLGSSGCGKSTTLNMIVGLEYPTSGDILIDGQSIISTPPGQRNVGLVFQDYAVFSSMTVRKNLAFGLEVRNKRKDIVARAVDEVAELLDMKDKLDVSARELGGSELQRVAIGRTLVTKPEILLLDEPLSNLEAAARLAMRKELRRLQSEIGLTIIYVTHDQVEALSLANRIAVMNNGKILQAEETTKICERPDHTFVAGFLGSPPMNLIQGNFRTGDSTILFEKNSFEIPVTFATTTPSFPDGRFTLGIRPEEIKLVDPTTAQTHGTVVLTEPRGPETIVTIRSNSVDLKAVAPSTTEVIEGDKVGIHVDPQTLVYFNNDTNRCVDLSF